MLEEATEQRGGRGEDDDVLFIVPSERHVERLAREGRRAETRASLRDRLSAALLPNIRFADAREVRLTLAVALEEARARSSGQLSLFAGLYGDAAASAGKGEKKKVTAAVAATAAVTTAAVTPAAPTADAQQDAQDDPLLATLRGRGGASWVRSVAAIDNAMGALRARGATDAHLERVRGGARGERAGVAAARAHTLAAAMRALDAALFSVGARDGRLVGSLLGPAIREVGAQKLESVIGASRLRARWLVGWNPPELAWWRALDETLARVNGFARVVLPAFDKRLEGTRERDPLELIADIVAKHLDAAPEMETIAAVLGDLATTPPPKRFGSLAAGDVAVGAALGDLRGNVVSSSSQAAAHDSAGLHQLDERMLLLRAADVGDQARAVASVVVRALREKTPLERIVIAYPVRDERTLLPIRRALSDEGVVFHDALGPPPSNVPVIAAALHALVAADSRDRIAVARLLRSGYIDASALLREPEGEEETLAHAKEEAHDQATVAALGEADYEDTLEQLAHALVTRATAAGKDPSARLIATASRSSRRRFASHQHHHHDEEEKEEETPVTRAARRIAAVLDRACLATTRRERVRAARVLFHDLGFGSRAGRGGHATFARDDVPYGVDGAERVALTRDVRAWEALESALDAYEVTALRSEAQDRPLDADVFRLELAELLDSSAQLPSAGRAAAVRIARLADVAGDELELLIVVDANDGSLPRDTPPVTLVSEALEGAVTRASRGGFSATQVGEIAARDLAALAMCAAEATRIVFVSTADDSSDTPARPSRIVTALERAGTPITPVASVIAAAAKSSPAVTDDVHLHSHSHSQRKTWGPAAMNRKRASQEILLTPLEIRRRARREREREAFFLDPARPQSDIIGTLKTTEAIRHVVSSETGDTAARALAVTSIERFAQCPFKGYAHVVLASREGEEQQELPDAREEGNLGHSALAAAFLATRDEWRRRPRDSNTILMRGLAAADKSLEGSLGHAPLRAIVRLRIHESVRAVLSRAILDETWDFLFAEQSFGVGRRWPAFEVTMPAASAYASAAAPLWLRGSIDRVDKAHDGSLVRVIDYKRSKNTVRDASSSLGETALQVPLYAVVAAQAIGAPSTGVYLPMQPRDLASERGTRARAGTIKPEERVMDLAHRNVPGTASEIERRVLAVATSVRSGRFAPIPAREAECTFCSVSGGCRKPRFAMTPADEAFDQETPFAAGGVPGAGSPDNSNTGSPP